MRTARSLPYRRVSVRGSLSRGVSVWGSLSRGFLSRKVHSVQGVYVQGVSVQGVLCSVGDLCPVGVLCPGDLCQGDPPGQKPPEGTWERTPGRNMGPETESYPEGTWDQTARQEVTSYRDPSVNRMTHTRVKTSPCLKLREVRTVTLVTMQPIHDGKNVWIYVITCEWILVVELRYRYGMHCGFRTQ